jgi:hypothetical protein
MPAKRQPSPAPSTPADLGLELGRILLAAARDHPEAWRQAVAGEAAEEGRPGRPRLRGHVRLSEVRRLFGVERSQLLEAIQRGELPARRLTDAPRSMYLVKRADVRAYLAQHPEVPRRLAPGGPAGPPAVGR